MRWPSASSPKQAVGLVGLYYVCYRLAKNGWIVMPTCRNARGFDIVALSPDLRKRITIEVESFSGRSAVSLGKSCEILADYLVIRTNVLEEPVTYVLSREEAERLIREDRKGEYWIEVKDYDREE
ncbi:MAG: hypothetical protein DRJ57_05800, partial [Thermoprotei archaeon]